MQRNIWPRTFMRPRCGLSLALKARHQCAGPALQSTPRFRTCCSRPALGLGATLTTLHLVFEKEAEAAMGLPPNFHSYALLPIGYPMGRFGPVRRVMLTDVVYEGRWGQAYRDL